MAIHENLRAATPSIQMSDLFNMLSSWFFSSINPIHLNRCQFSMFELSHTDTHLEKSINLHKGPPLRLWVEEEYTHGANGQDASKNISNLPLQIRLVRVDHVRQAEWPDTTRETRNHCGEWLSVSSQRRCWPGSRTDGGLIGKWPDSHESRLPPHSPFGGDGGQDTYENQGNRESSRI